MKRLVIIFAMIFSILAASGCAGQKARKAGFIPNMENDDQVMCARQCEYIHGGFVRGCNGQGSTASRSTTLIEKCIDNSYAMLRYCYRTC